MSTDSTPPDQPEADTASEQPEGPTFADLGLDDRVVRALKDIGYEQHLYDGEDNAKLAASRWTNVMDFVDWIAEDRPIERIADYAEWLARFEAALRALPAEDRHRSVLPLLHSFARPAETCAGAALTADRFREAVREAKVGPGDIPHPR